MHTVVDKTISLITILQSGFPIYTEKKFGTAIEKSLSNAKSAIAPN